MDLHELFATVAIRVGVLAATAAAFAIIGAVIVRLAP